MKTKSPKTISVELTREQIAAICESEASRIQCNTPPRLSCPSQDHPAAVLKWYRTKGRAELVRIERECRTDMDLDLSDPSADLLAALVPHLGRRVA